jgi:hypothetical protein
MPPIIYVIVVNRSFSGLSEALLIGQFTTNNVREISFDFICFC